MAFETDRDNSIVTLSELARQRLIDALTEKNVRGSAGVRISAKGGGAGGVAYGMSLTSDESPEPGDAVQDEGDFKILVDAETLRTLRGATVDFVDELMGSGFTIQSPSVRWDDPLADSIQKLIDGEINPGVASHGGQVELIEVKDNVVYVRLGGGCQGCGMVDVTLRQGIEHLIKQEFPQIHSVVDTTDHASGHNPYYEPSKGGADSGANQASPFYQPAKG